MRTLEKIIKWIIGIGVVILLIIVGLSIISILMPVLILILVGYILYRQLAQAGQWDKVIFYIKKLWRNHKQRRSPAKMQQGEYVDAKFSNKSN